MIKVPGNIKKKSGWAEKIVAGGARWELGKQK